MGNQNDLLTAHCSRSLVCRPFLDEFMDLADRNLARTIFRPQLEPFRQKPGFLSRIVYDWRGRFVVHQDVVYSVKKA